MNKVVLSKNFLILFVTIFLLSSCAGTRQLKLHRETLKELTYGSYSPQEKMDILGEEFVILLDEALSKPTALGTYKHVNKFINQNERELALLYSDLEQWQAEMTDLEKVGLGAKLATKSYTRRFITLLPKFKKKVGNKYKQLVFFSKVMKLFNPFSKKE